MRLLGDGYNYDSTAIRPLFDSHSTPIGPRYDHSTAYVPTVSLYLCVGAAALWPK